MVRVAVTFPLRLMIYSSFIASPLGEKPSRITSYNVCYTKLLRRETQYNLLQEKIQSVLIEMSHKLSREEVLSPSWFSDRYMNLNALLIKFSEIFYTDINLYSPEGTLLATSRFEVFKQGLQGERMDPMAYDQLRNQQRAQFIHNENIGKLNYLSAYVPFFNKKGHVITSYSIHYTKLYDQ